MYSRRHERPKNVGCQDSHGLLTKGHRLTARVLSNSFNLKVVLQLGAPTIMRHDLMAPNDLQSLTDMSGWRLENCLDKTADIPLCSTNTLKACEREAEELSLAGLKELVFGFTGREPVWDASVSECREPAVDVVVRSLSLPCWAPIALICTSPAERSSKTERRMDERLRFDQWSSSLDEWWIIHLQSNCYQCSV